jgi:TonB family protein
MQKANRKKCPVIGAMLCFVCIVIFKHAAAAAGNQQPAQPSGEAKQPGEWLKFIPEGASFSVLFPTQPGATTKGEKSGIKVHTYKVKTGSTEYQVVWQTNVPQEILLRGPVKMLFPRGLEDILKSARQAGRTDLVTTHEEDIALNGHKGRESTMESGSATIESKAFVVGYDFITLAVLHPKDESSAADAKRFLESLALPGLLGPTEANAAAAGEAGTSSGVNVDTRPIPLNRPRPNYTEQARKNGVQGIIRVRVLVGLDGLVKDVRFVSHLPDGLDNEAAKAVRQMRFKPATRAGQPVNFWQMLEVEFNLRERR